MAGKVFTGRPVHCKEAGTWECKECTLFRTSRCSPGLQTGCSSLLLVNRKCCVGSDAQPIFSSSTIPSSSCSATYSPSREDFGQHCSTPRRDALPFRVCWANNGASTNRVVCSSHEWSAAKRRKETVKREELSRAFEQSSFPRYSLCYTDSPTVLPSPQSRCWESKR